MIESLKINLSFRRLLLLFCGSPWLYLCLLPMIQLLIVWDEVFFNQWYNKEYNAYVWVCFFIL